MPNMILNFVGLCYLVHLSMQALPEYCKSSSSQGGPKLPSIPDNFMATVEVLDEKINNSNTYSMSVNWKEKRISAIENTQGGYIQDIYDYNSGMKMSAGVGLPQGFCQTTRPQFGPVGFSSVSKDKASFSDVLHYGDKYNLKYEGSQQAWPGMRVDKWTGCVNNKDVSIKNGFVFTTPDWTLSGPKQQLVAYYSEGYVVSGNSYRKVSLIYNFVNLKFGVPPMEKLSFRPGIYCEEPGRKCGFPKIPYEFEMNIEFRMKGQKGLFNVREKYHRIDHIHYDKNKKIIPLREIHDYNTGIKYEINGETKSCSMSPIPMKSWDAVETDDHHHIHMKSSNEFFGLNMKKYACKRPAMVRGIPVNGIAATASGTAFSNNQTVIKEWYFSQPGWMVQGMEGKINATRSVPLQQTWYYPNGTTLLDMHYFNYDPVETSTHILWILRYCYVNNLHYIYFRMYIDYDTIGSPYGKEITSALRDALAKYGRISKLRVSSIQLFKSAYGGVTAVRIYVLGLPAVKGTVAVLHPTHEIPLAEAVQNIKKSITTGNFSAKIDVRRTHSTPTITLRAQRYSYYDSSSGGPDPLRPTKNTKTIKSDPWRPTKRTKPMKSGKVEAGVSKGTAAAVAIILFLLAIVLTVVVMHVVLKRRGVRLFQFARCQNEPTTKSSKW